MNVWAIIPVKPPAIGKSRLSDMLGAAERGDLNRRLFRHVLHIALSTFEDRRIVVVTVDDGLLTLARACAVHALPEDSVGDLNATLSQAAAYAASHGADAILTLASDLPLLTAGDVLGLTEALQVAPACVIAPDVTETGTNSLALAPPQLDLFRFGPHSLRAHLEAARGQGIEPVIVRRPGLAQDLDTPDDFQRLAAAVANLAK